MGPRGKPGVGDPEKGTKPKKRSRLPQPAESPDAMTDTDQPDFASTSSRQPPGLQIPEAVADPREVYRIFSEKLIEMLTKQGVDTGGIASADIRQWINIGSTPGRHRTKYELQTAAEQQAQKIVQGQRKKKKRPDRAFNQPPQQHKPPPPPDRLTPRDALVPQMKKLQDTVQQL